jgi:hypothetical protein
MNIDAIKSFYGHYWWAIIILLCLSYIWIVGNISGWKDLSTKYGKDVYPFSYRIFLGATVYLKWTIRRSRDS